jgi:hypothetical protein
VLYENVDGSAYVVTESLHAETRASDPADVEIYRRQWDLLTGPALYGAEAADFVRQVLGEFS